MIKVKGMVKILDYLKNFASRIRNIIILSLLLNLINWVIVYVRFLKGEQQAALHYNIYFGIDYFGEVKNYFILPAVGAVIILINYFLARLIRLKADLPFYFLNFFILFYQAILLGATFLVLSIKS
ncbi:hypothetical protein C4569_03270 [Candidatus Parcubacteria bacterium]|nr:MAG: hypothetical protein C4569_03270 [Candidatus Parcubacteria bacterium]